MLTPHSSSLLAIYSHDSSSSTSKQVLQLLTSYNNPHRPTPTPSAGGHGESCVIEANGSGADATYTSDATSYLRQAASDLPTTPPIQLEIVDRKANPPTADQLRSIVDYLATDPNPTKQPPKYTTSGFNLTEHERRKKTLAQHLAKNDTENGMPKIKDGPLVVNWDEGSAATSLEGVKLMLQRLEAQSATEDAKADKDGSSGCIIC